jgi:hypothetical protein
MSEVRVHLLVKRLNLQQAGGRGYASKTADKEKDV